MDRNDPSFQIPGVEQLLELLSPEIPSHDAATGNIPALLPEEGLGDVQAAALLRQIVFADAPDLGAPAFFAQMDPPTPWITWVASFWNACLNQNLLHPQTGSKARELETRLIDWLAPSFDCDGGQVVPGATLANLTALWAARDLRGVTDVAASVDAHVSIKKAAHLLGLGYREIAVDEKRRMNPRLLGDLSSTALVLTAGTTSTGAIDPLGLEAKARWRHVDAAWAGPLRLTDRYKDRLAVLDAADSVTVSSHKWFFQPKESALIFFKNFEEVKASLSFAGGYLATPAFGIQGSHGATAIPLLATLLAWGKSGMAARIERCMHHAEEFAKLVADSDEFILFEQPVSGIVVWKPRKVSTEAFLAQLHKASVSSTFIKGELWLRSVAANPMIDVPAYFDYATGIARSAV